METIVEVLYSEIKELDKFLNERNEISYAIFVDSNFRKSLLLSAASLFEKEIKRIIEDFTHEKSSNNVALVEFLKNKAIARQFHTFFNWEGKNANSFFGLFGMDFKEHMKNIVNADEKLKEGIIAFLEIGNDRNRLVHQDYGSYTIEKTTDEIFTLYRKAMYFIQSFERELMTNGR